MMNEKRILVINCGSSSLKFSVLNRYNEAVIMHGVIEKIGSHHAEMLWTFNASKEQLSLNKMNHQTALGELIALLDSKKITKTLSAIGHRVVHGGEKFTQSTLITKDVIQNIQACSYLAPLHNPHQLKGIESCIAAFANLPQVAVFDTAFHQTMPAINYLYAIPYDLYQHHRLRRYGMHGTSYRFISQRASELLGLPLTNCNLLIAHLGNGASVCAIEKGKSIDTTMGLTPLEGLVMGTRSGDVDPNIFSFLQTQCGYTLEKTTEMLNNDSGLLGISGLDNDCRILEQAAQNGHQRAQLALTIFCNALTKKIASLATQLHHIDALIFTGGIGENSILIRATVMNQLTHLGFFIDKAANQLTCQGKTSLITTKKSKKAMVIPTNEELMIARDTRDLITKIPTE